MVDKKEPKVISRRQFLIGGGAVVATAVVLGVAACTKKPTTTPTSQTTTATTSATTSQTTALTTTPTTAFTTETPTVPTTSETTETTTQPTTETTPLINAAVVQHDEVKCTGCGTCVLRCSQFNSGKPGPLLSRTELIRNPFEPQFTFNSCQQCASPACYYACPKKDVALCIDPVTGTRYTNEKECIGCGKCIVACIYTPSRRKMNFESNVAINCNLCRGRNEGPNCVQYCPFGALQLIPAEQR